MSKPGRPGPRVRAAVVGALAAILLAGCAGTSPGVAVQVGEETISTNELDEQVSDYCTALEDQLRGSPENTSVLNRIFRSGMAGSMARRSIAEQIAEDYSVEAGERYDDKVATLQQSVSVLPEEIQQVVVDVETESTYVEAIKAAVGEQLLTEEKGSAGAYSEQVARGQAVFDAWAAENEVEFAPALGVDLVKGELTPVDTSLSYAAGDNARAGAAEQPEQSYAKSQPDSQRCN